MLKSLFNSVISAEKKTISLQIKKVMRIMRTKESEYVYSCLL